MAANGLVGGGNHGDDIGPHSFQDLGGEVGGAEINDVHRLILSVKGSRMPITMTKERLSEKEQARVSELIHCLFGLAEVVLPVEGFEMVGVLIPMEKLERKTILYSLRRWSPVICLADYRARTAIALVAEKRGRKFKLNTVADAVVVSRKTFMIKSGNPYPDWILKETGVIKRTLWDGEERYVYINLSGSPRDSIWVLEKFLDGDFARIRKWASSICRI